MIPGIGQIIPVKLSQLVAPQYLDNNGGDGYNVSGTGPINIAYPSTVNAGDLLILTLSISYKYLANTPAGWSQITYSTGSYYTSYRFHAFRKIATGSESGNFTVSFQGNMNNRYVFALVTRFQNINVISPLSNVTKTDFSYVDSQTLTVNRPENSLAVGYFFYNRIGGATCTITGTNWAQQFDLYGSSYASIGMGSYDIVTGSGNTSLATGSWGSNQFSARLGFAINP